jgi:hypothetical protein
MYFVQNNIKIFFIHIPRTSGTDIEIALCKKYNPQIIWPPDTPHIYFKDVLLGQYRDKNNTWHCATHFTHNEIQNLYDELQLNVDLFFTVIRNPVDRASSLYHFWRFKSTKDFLDYLYTIDVDDVNYNGIICDQLEPQKYLSHRRYHFLSQYVYTYTSSNNKLNIFTINQIDEINKFLNINRQYYNKKRRMNRINSLNLFNTDTINHIYKIYYRDFDRFRYSAKYDLNSPD